MPASSSPQTLTPAAALKQYFGFDRFRPGQSEIVEAAIAGRDLLVLMPTGGGKSLCYQLPALLTPGVTIVVSPLIALMQDQVANLLDYGIPATYLNSSLGASEARARQEALLAGEYKLLYVAPERLLSEGFDYVLDELATNIGIARLAVDEAHCVSEWGHDFRPEYRQLRQVRQRFRSVPVTALTATATERVREDIGTQLSLQEPLVHVASFQRSNLHYSVRPKPKQLPLELVRLIREENDGSAIVYCQSRKRVEQLAEALQQAGISALPYHAGMGAEARSRNQTAFVRDDAQVMVATIAFGMGIDKPDVRLVIHADLPRNLEGYYQESGRAGRDGLPARCILFFSAGDRSKIEFVIRQKTDPDEQRIARQQLRQTLDYGMAAICRQRFLVGYFGETLAQDCGSCDNCLHPVPLEDRTIEAQKFLSCVYRCGQRFGMRYIVEVLRGKTSDRMLQNGHDKLSTFGIGRDLTDKQWRALGQALLNRDYLVESTDGYSVLEIAERGVAVLKKEEEVMVPQLRADKEDAPKLERLQQEETLSPAEEELFQHLRKLRKQLADRQSVPPYVVFADRTLKAMAQQQPETLAEFGQLVGVGQKKLDRYGDTFLNAIDEFFRHSRQVPVADVSEDAGPTVTDVRSTEEQLTEEQSIEVQPAATTRIDLPSASDASSASLSPVPLSLVDTEPKPDSTAAHPPSPLPLADREDSLSASRGIADSSARGSVSPSETEAISRDFTTTAAPKTISSSPQRSTPDEEDAANARPMLDLTAIADTPTRPNSASHSTPSRSSSSSHIEPAAASANDLVSEANTSNPPPLAQLIPLGSSHQETLKLHQQGLSIGEIAAARDLQESTVGNHLAQLLAVGETVDIDAIVSPARQRQIFRAIFDVGSYASLTPIRELLGEDFTYAEIRLVRAVLFGQG